jgi:hypothetical protein
MEKAHLYEALYLVNHGIDEAGRRVQRLKKIRRKNEGHASRKGNGSPIADSGTKSTEAEGAHA